VLVPSSTTERGVNGDASSSSNLTSSSLACSSSIQSRRTARCARFGKPSLQREFAQKKLLSDPTYSHPSITMGLSTVQGRGVFATQNISAGTFLCQYIGDIVKKQHTQAFQQRIDYSQWHYFVLKWNSSTYYVFPTSSNHISLAFNHSLPTDIRNNVVPAIIVCNGLPHVCFFAKRNVCSSEELFFDYNERDPTILADPANSFLRRRREN
jgi:hypothetical protein